VERSDVVGISREEVLREVDEIRTVLGIGKDQNITYAELTIDGETDELIAASGFVSLSGMVSVPSERMFETFDVDHDRSVDAEVKLLEEIAQRLETTDFRLRSSACFRSVRRATRVKA
jgi:putative aminopeptidase FrvX